jgi:catechol 2,3-dioxygenase-like lactoylglutathione lyase family enzyme
VDVLSSRILLWPSDLDRSRRFYRDMLGLAIYREFGPADDPRGGVLPQPGIARGLRAPGRPCRALGDDLDPGTGCPRRARSAGRGRSPLVVSPSQPISGDLAVHHSRAGDERAHGPAEIHNGLALYQRGQGYPLLASAIPARLGRALETAAFCARPAPAGRAVLTTVSPATPRAWWLLNVSAR